MISARIRTILGGVKHMASKNILTCTAGEHFVAYRLSLMGYTVGTTRGGATAVDLLVTNSNGDKSISVQVKTSRDAFRER